MIKMIMLLYIMMSLFACSKNNEKQTKTNIPDKIYDNNLVGIYSSAASLDEDVMSKDYVKGVLIRVQWKDLEPYPNHYNWELIDNQLTLVNKYQKKWSLGVLAGSMSPKWLYDNFNVGYMNLLFRQNPVKIPHIYDDNLQIRFKKLIDNISNRYNSNHLLELVYLPQMTLNGIEGHFNGMTNETMLSEGFDEEKWIEYSLENLYYLNDKFPNKKVAIELHEILNSDYVAIEIARDILIKEKNENIGLAIWWLSGKPDYQPGILSVFEYFTNNDGEVFAQLIGNSSTPERFYNNDFREAFYQAKELKIQYIEVWNSDLKIDEWKGLFNVD